MKLNLNVCRHDKFKNVKIISETSISFNWHALNQSEFCNVLADSVLKRYHQKINEAQGHAERVRNFYDDSTELHPNSKEIVGDYILRAIKLLGYTTGPLFRRSVKLGDAELDKSRLCRGLPR